MNKAEEYFERGRDVADAGNFDYAIELFIHGISLMPDDVPTHKELRLIALERKARRRPDISRFDKLRLCETMATCTDPLKTMLLAVKLLAFDPDNPEWIKCCAEHARRANLMNAAAWFTRLEEELVPHGTPTPV